MHDQGAPTQLNLCLWLGSKIPLFNSSFTEQKLCVTSNFWISITYNSLHPQLGIFEVRTLSFQILQSMWFLIHHSVLGNMQCKLFYSHLPHLLWKMFCVTSLLQSSWPPNTGKHSHWLIVHNEWPDLTELSYAWVCGCLPTHRILSS